MLTLAAAPASAATALVAAHVDDDDIGLCQPTAVPVASRSDQGQDWRACHRPASSSSSCTIGAPTMLTRTQGLSVHRTSTTVSRNADVELTVADARVELSAIRAARIPVTSLPCIRSMKKPDDVGHRAPGISRSTDVCRNRYALDVEDWEPARSRAVRSGADTAADDVGAVPCRAGVLGDRGRMTPWLVGPIMLPGSVQSRSPRLTGRPLQSAMFWR